MSLTAKEKQQLEGLLEKLKQEPPKAAMTAEAMTAISKVDFRAKGTAVLSIAGLLASLTPTPKDDVVAGLLTNLFSNDENFEQICGLLGIV